MAVGIVSVVVEVVVVKLEMTLSSSFINGKDNSMWVKGTQLPVENCNACINDGD